MIFTWKFNVKGEVAKYVTVFAKIILLSKPNNKKIGVDIIFVTYLVYESVKFCQFFKLLLLLFRPNRFFENINLKIRTSQYSRSLPGLGIRSLVFRSNWSVLWSKDRFVRESLKSIFCKDRQDRFAHGRSFLKIRGIDSITVDLFQSCQSFSKIDGSDSITVDLFKR